MADPRRAESVAAFGQYGVNEWGAIMQTVIGKAAVGAGNFSVAEPRHGGPTKFSNVYSVVEWDCHAGAVTSSRDVAIADPRALAAMFHNAYKLTAWSDPAQTITGQHTRSNGAGCVARPGLCIAPKATNGPRPGTTASCLGPTAPAPSVAPQAMTTGDGVSPTRASQHATDR